MLRTAFLIDGFNLYHSARQAARDLGGGGTKWLDIRSLCESHLYLIDRTATLCGVHYFSALALHLQATNPDVTNRHMAFLDCLRDTGISVELAHFKKKTIYCPSCNAQFNRHEEKETDVAIAIKLFELFQTNQCDVAVLVTGDTDVAPAVRTVLRLFPHAAIWFGFPYARKNKELEKLGRSFKFGRDSYRKNQLPDPYVCQDGRVILKPTSW